MCANSIKVPRLRLRVSKDFNLLLHLFFGVKNIYFDIGNWHTLLKKSAGSFSFYLHHSFEFCCLSSRFCSCCTASLNFKRWEGINNNPLLSIRIAGILLVFVRWAGAESWFKPFITWTNPLSAVTENFTIASYSLELVSNVCWEKTLRVVVIDAS